jgi:hypothetical protein
VMLKSKRTRAISCEGERLSVECSVVTLASIRTPIISCEGERLSVECSVVMLTCICSQPSKKNSCQSQL